MKFSELCHFGGAAFSGDRDAEITSLACNLEDVSEGSLFICISGGAIDRHDQIPEAAARGAAAFFVEKETDQPVLFAEVKDARAAMSLAAKAFYGSCIDQMKLIAVTGTNGKTTTCHIIDSILRKAGYRTGLVGTCGITICGEKQPSEMTTPDPIQLHALFQKMQESGVQVVVMEASAHAIYLKKMLGTVADVAVFTNLTQDHLDFFQTMAKYKRAKLSYFTPKFCKAAVVNADDEAGREIVSSDKLPVVTYGYRERADVFATNLENSAEGLEYVLNLFDEVHDIKFPIPGKFNMYNSMAAAAVCRLLGVDTDTIAAGIKSLAGVAGRFSVTKLAKGCTAIVDFAHTPDGLENILTSARELCKGKLICVFGCGGNRDRKKRPMMGEVVSRLADVAVVTSDNPRDEQPLDIIADIVRGMDREKYYMVIESREGAIRYAVDFAGENDVIVVAGKGHEEYQEIGGIKYSYSDARTVAHYAES